MTPTCATCTVYSIGHCADCHRPQCGMCGRHYAGSFLCASCRGKRDVAAARAAARADEEKRQRARDAQEAARLRDQRRKQWLKDAAKVLNAASKPHAEGWYVSPAAAEYVTSYSGQYDRNSSTSYIETRTLLTERGTLKTVRRSKRKESSWRWSRRWVTDHQGDFAAEGIRTYVRLAYDNLELPPLNDE